jgi:hypothetical protein
MILIALLVNIAHDSVIAIEDQYMDKNVAEYVIEQTTNCNHKHMGEYHSLFHYNAIIITTLPPLEVKGLSHWILFTQSPHTSDIFNTLVKPPIV